MLVLQTLVVVANSFVELVTEMEHEGQGEVSLGVGRVQADALLEVLDG